jgi:Cd2+/Zn2+-exporting ATPase
LLSEKASLNTSALTGESKPSSIQKSEEVLAGMLNLDQVIEIETTRLFENSSIVRILQMVQDASSEKPKPNYSSEDLQRSIRQLFSF